MDSKHNFKYKTAPLYNVGNNIEVDVLTDATTLDDILMTFQDYLYACGFRFKGNIEIVEEEDNE